MISVYGRGGEGGAIQYGGTHMVTPDDHASPALRAGEARDLLLKIGSQIHAWQAGERSADEARSEIAALVAASRVMPRTAPTA